MNRANLAEIPADITMQILQYIAEPSRKCYNHSWPHLVDDLPKGNALRAIQSVRLTCRALSQIATPILFPVLQVSINYKSVNAFEQISKNPIIASKARGVIVNMAIFSGNMATDYITFIKERRGEIFERFAVLDDEMEFRLHDADEEDEDIKEYYRMEATLFLPFEEWDQIAPTEGEYGDILLHIHNDYNRRYLEQLECLNDPHTIQRLAAAFSRLKCGGKVHFSTEVRHTLRRGAHDLENKELMYNDQTLSHAIIQPYDWQDLYAEEKENDWTMVKILSSLPIALADANVPLTELYVGEFPHYTGFTKLLTHDSQHAEELEKELRRAFQNLQIFDFGYEGMKSGHIRHNPLSESDLSYMRAYLSAAMASPQLQELRMGFNSYRINTGIRDKEQDPFELGPVLRSWTSSHLTRLCLSNASLKFGELEPLLSQLGTKMTWLYIYDILLLDGGWAPLLDAIHKSTAQRCQDGLCEATLRTLLGAEFGTQKRKKPDIFNSSSDDWNKVFKMPFLLKKAQAYIRGKMATNPLRNNQKSLESSTSSNSNDSL